MKLRLRKNSIRLRLTQSEVAEFAERGSVEDAVDFGSDSTLRYRLRSSDNDAVITAAFDDGCVTIAIPKAQALDWAGTGRVGLEITQSTSTGSDLNILIEKDFACLEPRPGGEDDDTFPNPQKCGDGPVLKSNILEHPVR